MKRRQVVSLILSMALVLTALFTGCAGEEQPKQPLAETSQEPESEGAFSNLNHFEAETLDGAAFTQDNLSDKDVTVIDNDKTNDSHTHQPKGEDYIPNTNTTWEKLAEICGYRGEDRIKQAYEKWEEKKYDERNTTKDNKQLIEEIEEEINEEYGMPERGI